MWWEVGRLAGKVAVAWDVTENVSFFEDNLEDGIVLTFFFVVVAGKVSKESIPLWDT